MHNLINIIILFAFKIGVVYCNYELINYGLICLNKSFIVSVDLDHKFLLDFNTITTDAIAMTV